MSARQIFDPADIPRWSATMTANQRRMMIDLGIDLTDDPVAVNLAIFSYRLEQATDSDVVTITSLCHAELSARGIEF